VARNPLKKEETKIMKPKKFHLMHDGTKEEPRHPGKLSMQAPIGTASLKKT